MSTRKRSTPPADHSNVPLADESDIDELLNGCQMPRSLSSDSAATDREVSTERHRNESVEYPRRGAAECAHTRQVTGEIDSRDLLDLIAQAPGRDGSEPEGPIPACRREDFPIRDVGSNNLRTAASPEGIDSKISPPMRSVLFNRPAAAPDLIDKNPGDSAVSDDAEASLPLPISTPSTVALSAQALRRNAQRAWSTEADDADSGAPQNSRTSFRLLVCSVLTGIGLGIYTIIRGLSVSPVPGHVIAAGLSPDSSTLAVLRKRGVVEAWNVRTGTLQSQFLVEALPLQLVFAEPNRVLIFSRTKMYEWQPEHDPSGTSIRSVLMNEVGVVQKVIAGTDETTAFLLGGQTVTIVDLQEMTVARKVDIGPAAPLSVAASSIGNLIVCGDQHGNIKFWCAATGRQLHSLPRTQSQGPMRSEIPIVSSIAVDAEGELMAVSFRSGHIQLWDLKNMEHLRTVSVTPAATRLAFQPGKTTLIAGSPNRIVVLDQQLQQRTDIEAVGMNDPEWMQASEDGKLAVAFASEDKDLWIFDLTSMQLCDRLQTE